MRSSAASACQAQSRIVVDTVTNDQEVWIEDDRRWFLLEEKAMEVRAGRAFALFREKEIEPVLIKGLAAARFYPEPGSRASIDMDLAVSAEDFEAASQIAISAAGKGLAIDIHRELRHFDSVEWKDLFANSQLIDVGDSKIRVLRLEDHLRVLCVHWLTDGGAFKERLWDIYYGVQNRPANFDWDRFLNVVNERRRRWLVCAVGLAHHFLDLDLSNTPIEDEAERLPQWLVKSVEKEWKKTRFRPLETVLHDPKQLLQQILRRLNPNPVWATIQMEGTFDARMRVFYKIGSFVQRILPSIKRISTSITAKSK